MAPNPAECAHFWARSAPPRGWRRAAYVDLLARMDGYRFERVYLAATARPVDADEVSSHALGLVLFTEPISFTYTARSRARSVCRYSPCADLSSPYTASICFGARLVPKGVSHSQTSVSSSPAGDKNDLRLAGRARRAGDPARLRG